MRSIILPRLWKEIILICLISHVYYFVYILSIFKKFCLSPFESETCPWCICQWDSSQLHFISLVSYIYNVPWYFQVYLLTLPNFLCCFTLCIKFQWLPIIKGVKLKVSQPSIIGLLKTVLNHLPNQYSYILWWLLLIFNNHIRMYLNFATIIK